MRIIGTDGARTVPRRRTPRDGGVALVEFALVAPLFFALVLGMITGGITLNRQLSLTNGVREGSRFGATLSVAAAATGCGSDPLNCWLAEVADVTQQAADGQLDASVTNLRICVAYVYPGGTAGSTDSTRRLVRTAGGDTIENNLSCIGDFSPGSDGRPSSERRVQVVGQRGTLIEFVLGSSNFTLDSTAISRFEAAA